MCRALQIQFLLRVPASDLVPVLRDGWKRQWKEPNPKPGGGKEPDRRWMKAWQNPTCFPFWFANQALPRVRGRGAPPHAEAGLGIFARVARRPAGELGEQLHRPLRLPRLLARRDRGGVAHRAREVCARGSLSAVNDCVC
eukprot:gene3584-biopygen6144